MRLILAALCFCVISAGLILHLLLADPAARLAAEQKRAAFTQAMLAPPLQTNTTRPSFVYGKFRLVPRAEYDVTARVLSVRRYHVDLIDDFLDASPEDLALGWGGMADEKKAHMIRLWQEDRWFKYRWRGAPPLPPDEMIASMANTHMIPANAEMAHKLKHVSRGDIVHMTGALVDIVDPGKGTWSTSLSRTDTGPGACEILWLESLEIVPGD